MKPPATWWKEAVVYQIYPASFKDSTGTGQGDIPGIISKLDHLSDLGIDVLWVCPFFKSPQCDLGYDISDYQSVHAPYGTLADVEALIEGCHSRGIKIIFDLVVNHTSNQHTWFKESRSSKSNAKRAWYHWQPAKMVDGVRKPPCNWRGAFGGSVWEWDEATHEYYLHLFAPEQPDLNWENPEVRQAIYANAIRFWLDKGVDGFRIDTVNMYSKHEFKDVHITAPGDEWQPAGERFTNGPHLHEYLKEMYANTFAHYDCVTIGEIPFTPKLEDILKFIGAAEKELSMVIQFDLADLDHGSGRFPLNQVDWNLRQFKDITTKSQRLTEPEHDAWATTYLENHDQARSVTRYASDSPQYRVASAKMLAVYLLTLSGTPIIFEGEEIGMINAPKSWDIDEEYKDISTINLWRDIKLASVREPELLEVGRAGIQLTARDHARAPMQWESTPGAGFSTSEKTWMRVMDSSVDINVADQVGDPSSVLEFYKSLIGLRRARQDIFVYGKFEMLDLDNEATVSFVKRSGSSVVLVVLNFKDVEQPFVKPASLEGKGTLLLSSIGEGDGELAPYEARIYLFE